MTNEQAEVIGRWWIAAGGGWREGMLTQHNERVIRSGDGYLWVAFDYEAETGRWDVDAERVRADDGGPRWPDFRDAATRGAALEVVRERWGDAETYVKIEDSLWTKKRGGDGRRWYAITGDGMCVAGADTEAEALVAALEAAPKERG